MEVVRAPEGPREEEAFPERHSNLRHLEHPEIWVLLLDNQKHPQYPAAWDSEGEEGTAGGSRLNRTSINGWTHFRYTYLPGPRIFTWDTTVGDGLEKRFRG